MPRFAANLGWQFTEVPFLERFEAAAAVGFGAVEYPFPYAHAAHELALGYAGWIGLEYQSSRDTRASLIWARPYGIRA